MFLRATSFLVIVFMVSSAHAYKNMGVEHINPAISLRLAEKEGLGISPEERTIKKGLLKMQKSRRKEFQEKIQQGLENPDFYQGYLFEIKDGLKNVEKAKKIAKFKIYDIVEKNWKDLKLTALNVNTDKTFKKFKATLLRDLNNKLVYTSDKAPANAKTEGYHFAIAQWATMTVSKSFKTITWEIAFNTAHDSNTLQKGAEDIKVDTSSSSESDDSGSGEPAPSDEKK